MRRAVIGDPKWRSVMPAVASLRDPRDVIAYIHLDEETGYPFAVVVESPRWGVGRAEVPREIDRGWAIDEDDDVGVAVSSVLHLLTNDLGRRVAAADRWYAEFLEMVGKREQRRARTEQLRHDRVRS